MDGLLKDSTRPSRVKPLMREKIKHVMDMTLHATPANGDPLECTQQGRGVGDILQQCPTDRSESKIPKREKTRLTGDSQFLVSSKSRRLSPAICFIASAPAVHYRLAGRILNVED